MRPRINYLIIFWLLGQPFKRLVIHTDQLNSKKVLRQNVSLNLVANNRKVARTESATLWVPFAVEAAKFHRCIQLVFRQTQSSGCPVKQAPAQIAVVEKLIFDHRA
tara:strand:+ start:5775 stop:6092 length:318 start_codon:yes stop_codon:yes gene_type:complete